MKCGLNIGSIPMRLEPFLEKAPLATHVSKSYFFFGPASFLGTKMGPQVLSLTVSTSPRDFVNKS
jgi:hypothetical protein